MGQDTGVHSAVVVSVRVEDAGEHAVAITGEVGCLVEAAAHDGLEVRLRQQRQEGREKLVGYVSVVGI